MRITSLLLAMCLVACASQAGGPSVHEVKGQEQARWANRQECEQLVDHLQKIVFLDRQVSPGHPRYDAFLGRDQSPQWWQQRVDQCTITFTKGDYDCLMQAHDTRTADLCGQRQTEY